jgi:hypothetical protein
VAYAYNPSYSGSGDGKIVVQSQAGQKVTQNPISANKLDLGVHSCHSSHVGEIGRRILLIPAPGKSTRSYLKNNSSNNKRIWYELKNQCESTANAPPSGKSLHLPVCLVTYLTLICSDSATPLSCVGELALIIFFRESDSKVY